MQMCLFGVCVYVCVYIWICNKKTNKKSPENHRNTSFTDRGFWILPLISYSPTTKGNLQRRYEEEESLKCDTRLSLHTCGTWRLVAVCESKRADAGKLRLLTSTCLNQRGTLPPTRRWMSSPLKQEVDSPRLRPFTYTPPAAPQKGPC